MKFAQFKPGTIPLAAFDLLLELIIWFAAEPIAPLEGGLYLS